MFGSVRLADDRVYNSKTDEGGALKGARATIETSGEIEKRITATRLATTGVFALALRKKKDNRQLFLTVEGDGFAFVVDVDPKQEKPAREFAAKINAAAGPPVTTSVSAPDSPAPSASDQLRELSQLRDDGIISPGEFDAKKAEILQRM
jgi:hypothetical protein